ncbi:hypothetical protein F4677DRAFT_442161 [Hypoxylon crocopeplum]|nr:hypothetical protein F4677DRAFT_442161 [Hypoxylon crocopeplum]
MARKHIPYLRSVLILGLNGGLKWETIPREEYDDNKKLVKTSYSLIHHPHSFHITKVLTKGLRSKNPYIISLALADIYHLAADNSSEFTDCAFWAFTYKAFHARAIFLGTTAYQGEQQPQGQPLVEALDRFRETFLEHYPIEHAAVLDKGDKICQENIELAEDEVFTNKPLYDEYFPHHLTYHTELGDGTDKIIKYTPLHDRPQYEGAKTTTPIDDDIDLSNVPDEELFYYDTKCKSKLRDAFGEASRSKLDAGGVSKTQDPAMGKRVRDFDASSGGQGNALNSKKAVDKEKDIISGMKRMRLDEGEDEDIMSRMKRMKLED